MTENQERIEQASGWRPSGMSRWLADSILQIARDRAVCVGPFRWSPPVGAITGAFFPRRPGIQIAALWGGTGGASPGGSWQWRLLLVASWIICVESQVTIPINKSEGGESTGNGAPMPDGLARRMALTRILQTPAGLRHGALAGGGQSTVLIAGNRTPLA